MFLSENILKYVKYLLYALVFFLPLIYFPNGMQPFQIPKVIFLHVLVELIFALWLGLAIFNKEFRPQKSILLSLLCFYVLVLTVTSFTGMNLNKSLWSDEQRTVGLVTIYHLAALFLVIYSLGARIDWEKVWNLSFISAFIVSLIAVLQKFLMLGETFGPWINILFPKMAVIPERVGSTFGNSAYMSSYLLFVFFIGLYLILSHYKSAQASINQRLWFYALGSALILVAVFLSGTRSSILGVGIGFLFLLSYFAFSKQQPSAFLRKLSLSLLIFMVLFGGFFWLTKDVALWSKISGINRLVETSLENAAVRDRLITWGIAIDALKEKPFLGWGPENFNIAFNFRYNPEILRYRLTGTNWDKPHNMCLEYLVNSGIVGFLSFVSIISLLLFYLFKNKERINIYLIAAVFAYLVNNLFFFDTINSCFMLFLILSFAASAYLKENKKTEEYSLENISYVSKQKVLIGLILVIFLIPIYYNLQIFNASRYEYWGVNYFLNNRLEDSLRSFDKALTIKTPYVNDIKRNFSDTVKQAYDQGIIYPDIKNLQSKLAVNLEKVVNDNPYDFFIRLNLAEFKNTFSRYNPGYISDSEKLVNEALALSPKRQQSYYVLAKVKLLKKDINGAYEAFEDVIKLNPKVAEPHFYFGLMAYGLGDPKRGKEEIDLAKKLGRGPETADEYVIIGNFSIDYDNDLVKAKEMYDSASILVADNKKAAIYARLIEGYLRMGDLLGDRENNLEKAIKMYESALLLVNDVQKPTVYFKLVVANYLGGNISEAKKNLEELKKLVDIREIPLYQNPDYRAMFDDLDPQPINK